MEMAVLKRAGKRCAERTSDTTELEGIRGYVAGADNCSPSYVCE